MNDPLPETYFVDGGTLRPDTPSYVKRPCDDELFVALMEGEFCYILTPRQMGKSSLMIHTSQRLREHNIKTAVVDFQATGTELIREWYGSVLSQIRRGLRLSVDIDEWLEQKKNVGYGQLFFDFIHDVVLAENLGPVVIFIDEVDWMLKIDFRDDFFASIRAIYNARAEYPDLRRISFVLLGVASPAELIAEPTRTPFNIGHAISLKEFSLADAIVLEQGLETIFPEQGARILKRIFYWTNGQPYLTQKICKTIAENPDMVWLDKKIDRLVKELFLTDQARKESNLKFIQDRILNSEQHIELLKLYKRSLRSRMREDGQSILQSQLKLSGLLKSENGILTVRNRIYRSVFSAKWIREHQPRDWQRILNIALGVILGWLIVAFIVVSISDGNKEDSIVKNRGDFLDAYNNQSTQSTEKEIASLADIFRTKGILRELNQDRRARNLFFVNLKTKEDQIKLFSDYREMGSENGVSLQENPTLQEDLVVVIKGIYYSLAITDTRQDNTELLKAMKKFLTDFPDDTRASLLKEITFWVNARESLSRARVLASGNDPEKDKKIKEEYIIALANYGEAIRINSENPALYFERALLYIHSREILDESEELIGENALRDLEQVVSIIGVSSSQEILTQTTDTPRILTSTITPLSGIETLIPVIGNDTNALPSTPLAIRTATRRAEVILVTQTPATSSPTPSPISVTATPQPIIVPIYTPTSTVTPAPERFTPGFFKEGINPVDDISTEIENVLRQNPWLGNMLAANPAKYPKLQEVGLVFMYPTLTPSPTPTVVPTPTLNFPAFANLRTITEENAKSVALLGQLGKGTIREAVYAPDGKLLAVASSRGIYFYNSTNLDPMGEITTIDGVSQLAFSPNGQVIVSSLDDHTIYFWNVTSQVQVGKVLIRHTGSIMSLAFSSDGNLLATASEDKTVCIWRIRDGELLQTIEHDDIVTSVAFSPDSKMLASASLDDTIWLWNVPDVETISPRQPNPIRRFETYRGSRVAFSPDGLYLAAGSDDDSIRLWRVSDGQFITAVQGGGADLAYSPDGKLLAAVSSSSRTIRLLSAGDNSLKLMNSLTGHRDTVLSVSFSPDSKNLLSTSADNTVMLWGSDSGEMLNKLVDHVISPYVAISSDGELVASGSEDGNIYLWKLSEGRIIRTLEGHTSAVRSLAFNQQGSKLASASDDGTVKLWDFNSGDLLINFTGHTANVLTVGFLPPDDQVLVSGAADGDIRFWGVNNGLFYAKVDTLSSSVNSIAFSPSGYPLVAGLANPNYVRILDVPGSFYNFAITGHTDAVRSVAFSPDGETIVSGSDDSSVRLWNVNGYVLEVLSGHTDTVRSVVFSPDGQVIASASYDGTIRLWSANDGSVLTRLTGHRAEIYSMVFSPDGKFIISGSPDGTIIIWGLP